MIKTEKKKREKHEEEETTKENMKIEEKDIKDLRTETKESNTFCSRSGKQHSLMFLRILLLCYMVFQSVEGFVSLPQAYVRRT